MEQAGIRTFDQWASVFAEIVNNMELKPECDGKYQMKTRIQKYDCFSQLMNMYCQCADIKTAEMMSLPRPDYTVENVICPALPAIRREMLKISKRANAIRYGKPAREGGGRVDPHEDNFLKLTIDGKKVGLDMRLINPLAADDPKSKINICVDKVLETYWESTPVKGTQVIFCDISTPKKESSDSYAVYIKDRDSDGNVMPDGEYNLVYTTQLPGKTDFEMLNKKFTNKRSLPKDFDYDKLTDEDVIVIRRTDEKALEFAEVKACISGNPLVKKELDLTREVDTLRVLKTAFDKQKFALQDKALKSLPREIEQLKSSIVKSRTDADTAAAQVKKPVPVKRLEFDAPTEKSPLGIEMNGSEHPEQKDKEIKEEFPFVINGTEHISKTDTSAALREVFAK